MSDTTPALLIGTNAFAGVNHFSSKLARLKAVRFASAGAAKVMNTAVRFGANGVNFSPNRLILGALIFPGALQPRVELGLYPMIPDADEGQLRVSEVGAEEEGLEIVPEEGGIQRQAVPLPGVPSTRSRQRGTPVNYVPKPVSKARINTLIRIGI